MNIISRKDARAAGLKRYFTGKPCCRGHVCERWVSDKTCMECRRRMANSTRKAKWEAANPWRRRASSARYRAIKLGAIGSHTTADIKALLLEQNNQCKAIWCGSSLENGYHVDHIVALSRGGSNGVENLQVLCPRCNLQKHTMFMQEWSLKNGIARHLGRLLSKMGVASRSRLVEILAAQYEIAQPVADKTTPTERNKRTRPVLLLWLSYVFLVAPAQRDFCLGQLINRIDDFVSRRWV